jgi:YYY domain-containing protein
LIDRGRNTGRALVDLIRRYPYLLPVLILLAGAAFRFYNLNWDSGHTLHPDERFIYETVVGGPSQPAISWPSSISQFFDITKGTGSPLDPHNFNYGSLPFYLLAFVSGLISFLGNHVLGLSSWSDANTYGGLPGVGRGLSALLDLATVFLTFLIGRRAFGYWTGVAAMAFTAFTVLDIQLAHFFAVDTVLTPLALACILAAVSIAQTGSRRAFVWGGIAFGAAMATKTTAILLVAPLGAAAVLGAWQSSPFPRNGLMPDRMRRHYAAIARLLNQHLQWLFFMLFIGGITFIVCEPYAVLDRQALLIDLQQQTSILVSNDPPFGVPYTIQYANTTAYLFQLKNMLFWTLGIPLALAALAGFLYFGWRALRGRMPAGQTVLLLWVVPYFLVVGHFFAKFNRYMLPITPVLTLLGAALLVGLIRHARLTTRRIATLALAVVVGVSVLYSVAYTNIYANPNTRVAASLWIYRHIPRGSSLIGETAWDDSLPLDNGVQTATSMGYRFGDVSTHDMYAGETNQADEQAKINAIVDLLQHYDYFFMSSERVIGSIPRLPERFPVALRFYDLLFSNKLNFRLAATFEQHPQLGPVVVQDYGADESFHVYDHPFVRIFKRVGPIDASRVRALLTTGLPPAPDPNASDVAWLLKPKVPQPDTRLMLTAKQWQQDQQGGTMAQMFPAGGLGMQHPILVWLLLLELLGLLAFPFAFLLFSKLLDRGFVIAKMIGLLCLGYLVWITVSLGAGQYTRNLILGMLALFAVLSGLLAYRQRFSLAQSIRARWKYMLAGEVVFLGGFVLLLLIRMWYPDLGHQFSPVAAGNLGGGHMGEKQMELAFLNAIVRSRVFPPLDPFFAHGYINYYYYGLFLVGTLCKLATIAPATGFNLAIATFFGLLVGGAFSVVLTMTRRVTPGVIAAVLVGVVGNLNGGWQLIQGLMSVGQIQSSFPFFGGVVDTLSGLHQVVFAHQVLPPFDYWQSRSIVPQAISEFPYFTYIFADLHPHLIAYPMTLAAIAMAVNLMRGGYQRFWPRILALILGGVLLGGIAVTNPWDFPTYLAVVGMGAVAGAWVVRRRLSWSMLTRPGLWVASLALLSLLFYLPFKQGYQTVFATGIGLTRDITPQLIGCPSGQTTCQDFVHEILVTPLRIYLEHFGLFLFAVLSYVVLMVSVVLRIPARARRLVVALRFVVYYRDRLPRIWRAWNVARKMALPRKRPAEDNSLLWGALVLVVGLVVLRFYLLAFATLCLSLILFVAARAARGLSISELFALALAGFALLIGIGTQILFVKDFLAGGGSFRMNTIFKFYDQAWVLFALASAVLLYFFMARQMPRRQRPGKRIAGLTPPARLLTLLARRQLWAIAAIFLGFGALVYSYAGASARISDRSNWIPQNSVPFTLDGMAFMKVAYPDEYAAITWLNDNVAGAPVIAEAAPGGYDWRSRVSMFTGLPTIFNGIHEQEQRYDDEMNPQDLCSQVQDPSTCSSQQTSRLDDLGTLYNSTDQAQKWRVIRAYGVRYIFVGVIERQCFKDPNLNPPQCYSHQGVKTFDAMVGHGLAVAYRNPGVTIYQVTGA